MSHGLCSFVKHYLEEKTGSSAFRLGRIRRLTILLPTKPHFSFFIVQDHQVLQGFAPMIYLLSQRTLFIQIISWVVGRFNVKKNSFFAWLSVCQVSLAQLQLFLWVWWFGRNPLVNSNKETLVLRAEQHFVSQAAQQRSSWTTRQKGDMVFKGNATYI